MTKDIKSTWYKGAYYNLLVVKRKQNEERYQKYMIWQRILMYCTGSELWGKKRLWPLTGHVFLFFTFFFTGSKLWGRKRLDHWLPDRSVYVYMYTYTHEYTYTYTHAYTWYGMSWALISTTIEAKETYYRGKRDLLQRHVWQRRRNHLRIQVWQRRQERRLRRRRTHVLSYAL